MSSVLAPDFEMNAAPQVKMIMEVLAVRVTRDNRCHKLL